MHKEERWSILGILIVLALASPAGAKAADGKSVFVGASLGSGDFRSLCSRYSGTCDPDDTSYRVFGGYRPSKNMAIELGYGSIGEAQVNGTQTATGIASAFEVTHKAFDVSILPAYTFSERFAIFGRLGIYRAQLEARGTFGGPIDLSDHGSGFTFGAGLRLDFGRALGLRAEWQRFDSVGGGAIGQFDIDYYNAGLELRF